MPSLSPSQILERLDDSFRLLVGGSRTAPTRQQTLRATLDWSHGLLTSAEQAVVRRLAVVAGGCSLQAAEAVCSDHDIPADDILEILSRLVDKSLVVMEEQERQARYRLLEPVRQYAREQLVASRELDAVRQRHATYFLGFAEGQERDSSVGGSRRHLALVAFAQEYRNLQAALQWALDTRRSDVGLRLACTLQLPWRERGPHGEALTWITALLKLPGAEAPTPARGMALLIAAAAAWRLGDQLVARAMYIEAVPLARQLGDPWILFVALLDQGLDAQQRGAYGAARAFWTEGLDVARSRGDRISEARMLNNLGRLAIYEGAYGEGRIGCGEALKVGRSLGDVWLTSLALAALGLAAVARRRPGGSTRPVDRVPEPARHRASRTPGRTH